MGTTSIQASVYCPTCGLGPHQNFVDRIKNMLDEQEIVREGLWHEGPNLVDRLSRRSSLRDIARRSGLSPTYLSQVLNRKAIISARAFVSLSNLDLNTKGSD